MFFASREQTCRAVLLLKHTECYNNANECSGANEKAEQASFATYLQSAGNATVLQPSTVVEFSEECCAMINGKQREAVPAADGDLCEIRLVASLPHPKDDN